jgi:hypothetical protein
MKGKTMKNTLILSLLLLHSAAGALSDLMNRLRNRTEGITNNDNDDPDVSVFIGYKKLAGASKDENDPSKGSLFKRFDMTKIRLKLRYRLSDSVSAIVKLSQIDEIKADPNIQYVEIDPIVYPSGESLLYGLEMIQFDDFSIPAADIQKMTSSCSDPNSFKIGVSIVTPMVLISIISDLTDYIFILMVYGM